MRQTPVPGVVLQALWLAGGTLLGLALLLALLFAGRRLAGALSEALPPPALVLLAAALVCGRLMLAAAVQRSLAPPAAQYAASGLAMLATGLFLLAVSLPGSSPTAIGAAWFLWTAGEATAWIAVRPLLVRRAVWPSAAMRPRSSVRLELHAPAERQLRTPAERQLRTPAERQDDEPEENEIPAGLVQRLERVAVEDGETVYALVRVPLEAGSRLGIAHLAFCPPLARPPKLAGAARDEWAGDVQVAAAETYGARLEIRLDRPAQAGETVLVEVWSAAE